MTPEQQQNLRDWITGLRSGEYEQGVERLECGGTFCCLGVASVLDPAVKRHNGLFCYGDNRGLVGVEPSPRWFFKRFGLNKDEMDMLITMNDHEGKTFLEIADHLETLLPSGEPA